LVFHSRIADEILDNKKAVNIGGFFVLIADGC